MFRIGEFSKLTQVSIRMLRYYDETGLLKPAAIDNNTNYRLYAGSQINDLNKIIFLRDLGFNVTEIAAAVNKWNNESLFALLDAKRHDIENAIKTSQEKLSKIELAKRDICQQKIAVNYNVSVKSIPGYQVLSLRRVVPDYYAEGLLWKEMAAYAKRNNISVSDNTFTIYHDEEYKETDVDIEICAPIAAPGPPAVVVCPPAGGMGDDIIIDDYGFSCRLTEPVPLMACTMVYGSFENIAGAFLSLADWLGKHNQYKMGNHSRQIVHRGPWNEEIPDKYLTEIQVPLEKI